MDKPSKIQEAYNKLIAAMKGMAKDAGGFKVSDISAVREMTQAIKDLKQENAALKAELEAVKKHVADIHTAGDLIIDLIDMPSIPHNQRCKITRFDHLKHAYSNKIEAGE